MEIRTLENTPLSVIAEGFNQAFADYLLPMHMTEETLAMKIRLENIQLYLSPAVFQAGRLVGFILMGAGVRKGLRTVYNGGTGVLPEKRGNGLTRKMYEYIDPVLKGQDVEAHLLEVLENNDKAIHVYKSLGFEIQRTLGCYKKTFAAAAVDTYNIEPLSDPDWSELSNFLDSEPSWQNDADAIRRAMADHIILGINTEAGPGGYGVIQPATGRLRQFGVRKDLRNRGAGTALFQSLANLSAPGILNIVNLDDADVNTVKFLRNGGFERYAGQYEMTARLSV